MDNPILAFMQTQIGQSMSQSLSPVARWLDGTLKAVSEGSLTVEFTVREEMTNPMGILHGGISAAMMDDVLGATVFSLGEENFFTSVNLNVDYLSSAKLGEVVTVHSRVVRKGRNIIHAECQITNAEGKLLVKSTTNLLQTGIKVPR
ncbi:MAG: PaaI family thioesterase [Ferruginibacter sp.]|nr:PaaI family thioesterase [Cytophagales bacterium]